MSNEAKVSQTWTKPFVPPESIPRAADVVIIGGGIVGVSTAWFLSKAGISVALCEKGHIACEQSGRNWGWVRQQGRDTRELPIMIESMRIWEGLEQEIGEPLGFSQRGCFFTAKNERELERLAEWIEVAKAHELDTRIVSAKELADKIQGSADKWAGALFTSNDARAEPHKAAPAIARAAARNGADVLTACAVRGIETAGGKVAAILTEHGKIRTSTVLCAAGAWTAMFCRSIGIELPQLRVRGTAVRTAPAVEFLSGALFDARLGIRRREDGGYTIASAGMLDHAITPASFRYFFKFLPALMAEIGSVHISIGREFVNELRAPKRWALDRQSPFELCRVLNPQPTTRAVSKLRKVTDEDFPQLAGTEFVEAWSGMIESTPDVIPVIDAINALPGFYIATGFSGHGFGIGPGAGKVTATLLTGGSPGFDLAPLRLSRFFDGSPIRPQSAI